MTSNNMYKIGDCVYFETAANLPYQIRRIDELNKTPTGAVEARVTCFYRRRDIPASAFGTLKRPYLDTDLADAASLGLDDNHQGNENGTSDSSTVTNGGGNDQIALQKHAIKQREVFLSRQVERLPATHIRGKCCVTLFNFVEPLVNYLNRDHAFYYRFIYDPSDRSLTEDRGTIRIGSNYQCDIQPFIGDPAKDARMSQTLEHLVWDPVKAEQQLPSSSQHIDLFLTLNRATGLYARAHDPSSQVREPLLLPSSANACRDVGLQRSHDLLHEAEYDLPKAMQLMLPGGQPVICRDQLEQWSPSEAALFETGLDKMSKSFFDIHRDLLPWKSGVKPLVEYYYFWKTSDRYLRHRRAKLASQDCKLKQVYIPNYSKPNPSLLYSGPERTGCDGCSVTTSPQWFAWNLSSSSSTSTNNGRVCPNCWNHWKNYAGLKNLDPSSSKTTERTSPSSMVDDDESAAAAAVPTNGEGSTPPPPPNQVAPALTDDNFTSTSTNAACSPSSQNTVAPNSTTGIVAPIASTGPPRCTQYFATPIFMRLARVVCSPNLVRPRRLARRPHSAAELTGLDYRPAPPADEGVVSSASTAGATPVLSFNDRVKTVAASKIANLADPSTLLNRCRRGSDKPAAASSSQGRKIADVIISLADKRSGHSAKRPPGSDPLPTLSNGTSNSPPPPAAKKAKIVVDGGDEPEPSIDGAVAASNGNNDTAVSSDGIV